MVPRTSERRYGALPYFSPRADIPQLLATMQRPSHRRYLAGDYTEARYAGWDGAVASGRRAAGQIVQQLQQSLQRRRIAAL